LHSSQSFPLNDNLSSKKALLQYMTHPSILCRSVSMNLIGSFIRGIVNISLSLIKSGIQPLSPSQLCHLVLNLCCFNRLQHPSDQHSGYPLTVQVTPPLLDLCRACTKIPAVWSVVGDVRLGESPCVMCEPCWRNMGDPHNDKVIVVPLSRYELGL